MSRQLNILFANSFDLQLENFGVDMDKLKSSKRKCVFRAWLEEWAEALLKKNNCVPERKLLEEYRRLVSFLPRQYMSLHHLWYESGVSKGEERWMVVDLPVSPQAV